LYGRVSAQLLVVQIGEEGAQRRTKKQKGR